MALTVYPAAGWNTFIDLADATQVISDYTLYLPQWTAASDEDKERYLRIATAFIVEGLPEITDPAPECLGDAEALIAVQDLVYGFSASTASASLGAIKKEKAGQVEMQYYDTKDGNTEKPPVVPALARACLANLGFIFPSGVSGLTQMTLGRS
jgi:hypothetical protein